MRLYRGLKNQYAPDRVAPTMMGTDFTDCPFTALQYARGRQGMLIVLDLPDDVVEARVTEEIWEGGRARRWMVWGSFDAWIAAILPAKDARAVVRMKGVRAASDELRSDVLRLAITRHLAQDSTGSLAAQADPWVWGARP